MVCPNSYCEDHLPADARMMGRCERFEALGQRHPQQACFVLCSPDCVTWAKGTGDLLDDAEAYGTAAGILGATGMDTTKQAQTTVPLPEFKTDARADLEKLDDISRAAILALVGKTKPMKLADACPRYRTKAAELQAGSSSSSTLENIAGLVMAQQQTEQPPNVSVVDRVGNWKGALEGVPASQTRSVKTVREKVASVVLRLERTLDTYKTYELTDLAMFLDVTKISMPYDQTGKKKDASAPKPPFIAARPKNPIGMFCNHGTSTFNRKMLVKVLSLFLAWPLQTNLFVVKATAQMVGDDVAKDAELAAEKKGKGVMKRRQEAKALRDEADALKRLALADTSFLYALVPDVVAKAFRFPLQQPSLTVYTQNRAVGAPTIDLRLLSYIAPPKKPASSNINNIKNYFPIKPKVVQQPFVQQPPQPTVYKSILPKPTSPPDFL